MPSEIRCCIVDDKPLAIDLIRTYADKIPFLRVVHTTMNPLEALSFIHQEPVDLVFLDIQMPELTGLQLATLIGLQTRIIFTTAYADYALDGFEHSAIDYLVKPVSFERFYKAALKAKAIICPQVEKLVVDKSIESPKTYLFVKSETRLVKVDFNALLFVESMQNYCLLHTSTTPVMTLQTMKQMQEQLPDNQFVRAHKSYLVNIDKIDSVERSRIVIGKTIIPVGDSYREDFYQRLTK